MHRTISFRQALLFLIFILGSSALFSQVKIRERVEIKPSQPVRNTSSHTMQEEAFFEPLSSPDQLYVQTSRPCIITATCEKLPPYDPASNSPNDGISFFLECEGAPQGEYWLGATGVGGISVQTVTFNATSCATMHVAHAVGGWGAGESLFGECIVTVSANSATFQLNGQWRLRRPITAIVTLTAQPDTAYDLASLDISAAPAYITQCSDYAGITISALDKRGEPYSGISCDGNPIQLMTVSVPPSSKATLEYNSNGATIQGKDLTLRAGDMFMTLRLNYQAGDPADSVVVTVASQGRSAQTTVYLSIDPTQPYLTADISPGEVRYGLKSSINVQLLNGCGSPITVSETTKFKFEITGAQQFGYLVDPATGKSGTMLDQVAHVAGIASVEYRAYGQEPSDWQDVPLTISISDPSVAPLQTDIYVKSNDLRITPVPSSIHFGESARLTVEKKNSDGTYSAIPSDWQTAFQLVYSDTNGYLYSPDSMQSGTTVSGAFQSASYYARPRQVQPDSVDVAVFVTTADPNVILSKANQGKRPKLGKTSSKIAGSVVNGKKPIGGKNLIAMDEPPDLGPGIQYFGVGRLVVKRSSQFTKFVVRLSKDTLAYPQTADLTVIAVDKDSQEVAIDTSRTLFVAFDDGGPYVDFIRAPGDTVETTLNNISYGTLRSAKVKIVAVKKTTGPPPVNAAISPAKQLFGRSSASRTMQEGGKREFPKSQIMVTQVSDVTKVGTKYVVLKPTIKVIAVQDSIKPFYPDPDHPSNYLIDTTESRTKVKIAVTVSGVLYSLPPTMIVTLTSAPLDSSGGHSHITNRPKGKFGDSIRDTVETKDFETGKDTIRTSYLAPMFGGIERIIATLTSSAIADTDTVVVRVPRIVPLPESEDYDMTGGTDSHHGSRLDTLYPNGRTPNNNHGIDSTVMRSLQDGAKNFRYADWNTDEELMRINDISLSLGGGFDIAGQWRRDIQDDWKNRGHGSHRTGKDVDIENLSRLQELKAALEDNGWEYQKEKQSTRYPHFHCIR